MSEQSSNLAVRVASTSKSDTSRAIETLLDELDAASAKLTLVFYGINHDDQEIARVLDRVTGARGVAGTTAGELNCQGFASGSMTGISFHGPGVRAAVEIIHQLRQLSLVPIVHLPDKLARGIERSSNELDPSRHLWLFLVDGVSGKEGLLTPFFMQSAPRVGLVGASLGDGGEYVQARLVHHGRVYRDAAAAILLEYDRPFRTFRHTHVALTERQLEVTKVSQGGRCIEQLDGNLALVSYAEALGLDPSEITQSVIATHPLGYRFRGRPFPVSVVQIHDDGSFRVANSVQYGEKLNILEARDLVGSTRMCLEQMLDEIADDGGDLLGMLLFHCLSRHIEATATGQLDELGDALCQGPICGLNTYGEQFETLHLNHSLTGVLFG